MVNFPKFDFVKFENEIFKKNNVFATLANLASLAVPSLETNKNSYSLTEEEVMKFEERAAIMEYDGGLSRKKAEEEALNDIILMRDNKFDNN
ncbi:hypothetical protein [Rickettsiales endosymbiont of Stachyamoeba lipophora]|uniref:hypothetical protein n=1 Tax=Rickettsiales endosymbiont of Stachyamoeba lipophora TaxID=2486578 RepID=UPI000F64D594|nr:hypothetical protein [Rickettsiales endosymbiont of Stachyamoeba lipophora]AZL16322.1 hypothetical protein EF513_07270 [Rickettsiales endosymbiont of Stachyamoeba lipophora]